MLIISDYKRLPVQMPGSSQHDPPMSEDPIYEVLAQLNIKRAKECMRWAFWSCKLPEFTLQMQIGFNKGHTFHRASRAHV